MEMRRFGESLRKRERSCAGVVRPPSSSCGTTFSAVDDTEGIRSDASVELFSSGGRRKAAEGAWKARRESRTECI